MKIEKLNENKIRFTFNNLDLEKNNITVHSFMSNSIESQNLFLNMLDQAEREIGFITDDYKLSVQAIALSNGTFIITVTKLEHESLKYNHVHVSRKNDFSDNSKIIYKFCNFDDFCNFKNFINNLALNFNENNSLYQCNSFLFLIIDSSDKEYLSYISGIISEFAVPIQSSELLIQKLIESGKLICKNVLHKK